MQRERDRKEGPNKKKKKQRREEEEEVTRRAGGNRRRRRREIGETRNRRGYGLLTTNALMVAAVP